MVGPIGLDRIPEGAEALVIGIAVLHDQPGDALGALQRETPADRRAVVHDVHRVPADAEASQQPVHQRVDAVESVGEGGVGRYVALAEAGVVGRDDAVAVGECRDQVAKHVRGSREAV
jgi:hypothetical protein